MHIFTQGAVRSGLTFPLLLRILKIHSAWLRGSLLQGASEFTSLTWGDMQASTNHLHGVYFLGGGGQEATVSKTIQVACVASLGALLLSKTMGLFCGWDGWGFLGCHPWTSGGVHLHAQQQPSPVLWEGKPKTSTANFQSCLTSTKAALRKGLAVFLHLSVSFQADPSCLHVGQCPVARTVRDHLTIAKKSSQVSEQTLLCGRITRGILRF